MLQVQANRDTIQNRDKRTFISSERVSVSSIFRAYKAVDVELFNMRSFQLISFFYRKDSNHLQMELNLGHISTSNIGILRIYDMLTLNMVDSICKLFSLVAIEAKSTYV